MSNIAVRTKWLVVALVLVVALAAGLRLFDLGVPAFRADTMLFFDICHRPLSAWVVFTQWMELVGRTAQFPVFAGHSKLFIDVLHLTPTAFMIRLPNALFGILIVLGMYMLGRQMAGRAAAGLFVGPIPAYAKAMAGRAWRFVGHHNMTAHRKSLHAMKAYSGMAAGSENCRPP